MTTLRWKTKNSDMGILIFIENRSVTMFVINKERKGSPGESCWVNRLLRRHIEGKFMTIIWALCWVCVMWCCNAVVTLVYPVKCLMLLACLQQRQRCMNSIAAFFLAFVFNTTKKERDREKPERRGFPIFTETWDVVGCVVTLCLVRLIA